MNTIHKHPNAQSAKHRSRRLKSIAALPALLTLGNLIFDFAAEYFASKTPADRHLAPNPA
jgi:hypothetical protein